jgi:copper chaperone CopZ
VLIRQTAPEFGAEGSPYAQTGEWQVNVSLRNLRSTDHYSLDQEQLQRQTLGTYVVNQQHAADLTIGYQLNPRIGISVGIPFVSASWSIPSPTSGPGPRAQQDARGIGDISAAARFWMFDTKKHTKANIAIGVGVKTPTGNSAAQDMYPDSAGNNNQLRYVDQSVQPGDGGWGITTDVQAFRRMKRVLLFASGSYLLNPRNKNDTPSLTVARLAPGATPSASNFNKLVNSVPDQYLVRTGTSVGIGRGLAGSVAWRMEGMPRYDLIGRSDGFRRPGLEMFIEPGVSYSIGRSTWSFNVPIGIYRNRKPDAYTGLLGDATFPKAIVLASYSMRFGGLPQFRRPATPITSNNATPGAAPAAAAAPAAPRALPDPGPGRAAVGLDIAGMTCDQCADAVRRALLAVKGVASADVTVDPAEAVVVYDPGMVKTADLVSAVNHAKGMNAYRARIRAM